MENKVNIYNQMLSGVVRSIDELASESQKYLLENEKFGQCAQYFIQIVGQAIQIINTPAIRLVDTAGEDHYIVAGEKWKVFAAIIADIPGTALRPIVATNPFTMKVDRYETTKENAMEALVNYEETYNQTIDAVMEINMKMVNLQNMTSNNDKVKVMREIGEIIKELQNYMTDYYKDKADTEMN